MQELIQVGHRRLVAALHPMEQVTVVDIRHVGDELRNLVEPVQHDDHGQCGCQDTQVILEPSQRIAVEPIEGFVQNEQIRLTRQRSDEHDLASLTGREFAERSIDQRLQAQRVDQLVRQITILTDRVDDVPDGCALRNHIQDVGIILATFGFDELGLSFVGNECDPFGYARPCP